MRLLYFIAAAFALILVISSSACASIPTSTPQSDANASISPTTEAAGNASVPPTTAAAPSANIPPATLPKMDGNNSPDSAASLSEILVYASDVQPSALTDELYVGIDPASPNQRLITLPNTGDKLDAPPEDDPHITFTVQVQGGVPYRCWIHMRVGPPKGVSRANLFYVQFSNSLSKSGQGVFMLGTGSYMTVRGSDQIGWQWVGCKSADPALPDSLIYFAADRKVIVRMQAGAEGVGFDQFLLSPARYLNQPPSAAVLQK